MTTRTPATPNYQTITKRQQKTWTAGGFARTGSLGILHSELLRAGADVHPGERALDVATGNGGASLAARGWADVTATDFIEHLPSRANASPTPTGCAYPPKPLTLKPRHSMTTASTWPCLPSAPWAACLAALSHRRGNPSP